MSHGLKVFAHVKKLQRTRVLPKRLGFASHFALSFDMNLSALELFDRVGEFAEPIRLDLHNITGCQR